jgi:hypothetical protein
MHLLANGGSKPPLHMVSFLSSSMPVSFYAQQADKDACTACMYCIIMRLISRLPEQHMLCSCICLMVKIRPIVAIWIDLQIYMPQLSRQMAQTHLDHR